VTGRPLRARHRYREESAVKARLFVLAVSATSLIAALGGAVWAK
jgi:hypothetical protein